MNDGIMEEFTKSELVDLLKSSVMEVTFTKTNGEQRVMKCTLVKAFLPEHVKTDKTPEENPRHLNENVIACWDVEKQDWRSFRVSSVVSVETVE